MGHCCRICPLQLCREPFTQCTRSVSRCLARFPGLVLRGQSWVAYAAVQRHGERWRGKNICFRFWHGSPLSLAGKGEGCHYFIDESGKTNLCLQCWVLLWFWIWSLAMPGSFGFGRIKHKNTHKLLLSPDPLRPPSPVNPCCSHRDPESARLVLGLASSTWQGKKVTQGQLCILKLALNVIPKYANCQAFVFIWQFRKA